MEALLIGGFFTLMPINSVDNLKPNVQLIPIQIKSFTAELCDGGEMEKLWCDKIWGQVRPLLVKWKYNSTWSNPQRWVAPLLFHRFPLGHHVVPPVQPLIPEPGRSDILHFLSKILFTLAADYHQAARGEVCNMFWLEGNKCVAQLFRTQLFSEGASLVNWWGLNTQRREEFSGF